MNNYSDFSNVYDLLTQNIDYTAILKRVNELFSKSSAKSGHILDLGCGTATLSIALCKEGFDVIGVDASEDMLSVAQEKAARLGLNILFLCQDLSQLDLFGTAVGAVCSMDIINHIESKEKIHEFFRRLSLFLEMDSYFIFDMNTPYKHKSVLSDNTFTYDTDDVYCVWQNEYERDKARTHISLDFFVLNEDGSYSRSFDEFYEYEYDISLICDMLKDTGFEIDGIFDEYSDKAATDHSQRVSIVAKKTKLVSYGEIK